MVLFSIVIPLYNKESFIKDTLKSVLSQTFQDFEVIIVNDGSTDNSLNEVLKIKDSRIKVVEQENQGAAWARNHGIKQANGLYIALLDADDTWKNNHLFELKKQIDCFPEAGLFCNNYEIYSTENTSRPAVFNFNFDKNCLIVDDYFKASIINSVAWTSAVGFSKEKFLALGGFNPQLNTGQDIDLWIRFALNYPVSFNPTITMEYKLHVQNSLSKQEQNEVRYQLIKNYRAAEQTNPSLKLYLDINRYAIAIRCKMNNQHLLFKKVKKEIALNNLNLKQRLLLLCPKYLLVTFKQLQKELLKRGLYLTAYK